MISRTSDPLVTPQPQTDLKKFRSADRGAVTVEMGLMMPVLALLILGLVGFGLLYNAQITLQGAVREGARTYALDSGDPVTTTQAAAPGYAVNVVTPGGNCTPGQPASVTATTDYSFNFMLFTVDRTLTATAVMRCEREGS